MAISSPAESSSCRVPPRDGERSSAGPTAPVAAAGSAITKPVASGARSLKDKAAGTMPVDALEPIDLIGDTQPMPGGRSGCRGIRARRREKVVIERRNVAGRARSVVPIGRDHLVRTGSVDIPEVVQQDLLIACAWLVCGSWPKCSLHTRCSSRGFRRCDRRSSERNGECDEALAEVPTDDMSRFAAFICGGYGATSVSLCL